MIWPFPRNKTITTPWDDPRPISNPGQHVHGAIDVKTPIGAKIIAPEDGDLFLYYAQRQEDGPQVWSQGEENQFPWRNYFYDMYGAILVLKGKSGLTHLFAHSYINQVHNKRRHDWAAFEEKAAKRFPLTAMIAGPIKVKAGKVIGWTGNAGYSTGPHCHYEIHEGFRWQRWEDRPDPEKIDWRY